MFSGPFATMKATQKSDLLSDSVAPGPAGQSRKPIPDNTLGPTSHAAADAASVLNTPVPYCASDDESHGSKNRTGSFYSGRAVEEDPDSGIESDEEDELPELTEGSFNTSCSRHSNTAELPDHASSKSFGEATGATPRFAYYFKSNHYNSPLISAPPNSRSGSRGAAPPVPPRAAGSGYWPPKTANPAASFSRAPGAEIRETIGARPSFNQTPLSVNSRGFPVAPPFFLSILLSIRDPFWQEYVARPLSAARAFMRELDEDPSRPFLHVQGERYLPSLNKVFRQRSRTFTC